MAALQAHSHGPQFAMLRDEVADARDLAKQTRVDSLKGELNLWRTFLNTTKTEIDDREREAL